VKKNDDLNLLQHNQSAFFGFIFFLLRSPWSLDSDFLSWAIAGPVILSIAHNTTSIE